MQIYLPIAELSINIFLLLGIGGGIGFLSGLFGVGGGFLLTPLLIFIGVPPAVAVATQANQVVASSVSGVLAHWSRDNVDFKMGFVLLAGGIIMEPAMDYQLGLPTTIVVGTSLFQIIFVSANVTFQQAVHNQTVDLTLAMALTVGGVIGAQIGGRVGAKLPGEQLRVLLAGMILFVAGRLAYELGTQPGDLYSAMWLAPQG